MMSVILITVYRPNWLIHFYWPGSRQKNKTTINAVQMSAS